MRNLLSETSLSAKNLIYPLFVKYGKNVKEEISSMPGIFQLSVENAVKEGEEVSKLGIPAVLVFGIPEHKDDAGTSAYDKNGVVQQTIRALKKEIPSLLVITDVCLCEYTSHGHCGIIEDGKIRNDDTIQVLVKEALSHAEAGADMVAPSDMMDGRVKGIRNALDENGFPDTPIMAYSAKYSSVFYGPFREAAESAPQFGDRKSYQMDYRNSDEALREIQLDIQEGADIVMVKPALAYLDIVRAAKETFNIPLAAYNVSGEYSMVKAAALNGWLDGEKAMLEMLYAIKRAGADIIITYFAKEAAKVL